jgi:hypothetical protein
MLSLLYLAGKYFKTLPAHEAAGFKSRQRFIRRNRKIQEEFGKFFSAYQHLCPDCEGCCPNPHLPYWEMDRVLYGLPWDPRRPKEVATFAFFQKQLGNQLFSYLKFPLKLIRGGAPEAGEAKILRDAGVSECLGPNGCTILLGMRPAWCIFSACGRFLENMKWAEYLDYVQLSLKYMLHLSHSLLAVAGEWHHRTGGRLARR